MRRFLLVALLLAGCGGAAGNPSVAAVPVVTATPVPSGIIVFTKASYSCAAKDQWGFTAYLKERAGGLKVTMTFASSAGKSVDHLDVDMTSPDNTQFSDGPVDVTLFCAKPFGPGTYTLRIVRPVDAKVLATGSFAIAT